MTQIEVRPPEIILGLERWIPAQRTAARLLAIGYTRDQVSRSIGVSLRTLYRWCERDAFWSLVEELHGAAWVRVEPRVSANLELALDVQAQMLRGEVGAEDPRYRAAERLINRFVERLFSAGEPEAAG